MSTVGKARVQYGKASKRIKNEKPSEASRENSANESAARVERKAQVQHHGSKVAAIKPTAPNEAGKANIHEKKLSASPSNPGRTSSSQSPTRAAISRKRKREESVVDSETTDSTDELAQDSPKHQALFYAPVKRQATGNDNRQANAALKTPPRPANMIDNTPQQTPKLARDLSDLFISPHKKREASRPVSPSKSSRLKRMLSKSRTELILDLSAQPGDNSTQGSVSNTPQKATSMPTVLPNNPPTFNRNPLARDRTPSPTLQRQASPPPISRSPQRPGRTYSKSRSFLMDIPRRDSSAMELDKKDEGVPLVDHDEETTHRESYSELRSRWGLDDSEQDPTLNVPINEIKSAGEMRSRGETRRFLDEIGYLFDGLDSTSGGTTSSAKRASAIEIVSRMKDPEFCRRAAAANFVTTAWTALRHAGAGSGNDKILDAALVAFAALAIKDQRQLNDIHRIRDFIEFLNVSLEVTADSDVLIPPPPSEEISWARKQGLSRTDRTSLAVLRTAMNKNVESQESQVVSQRLFASDALSKIVETGQPLTKVTFEASLVSLSDELSGLDASDPLFSKDGYPDLQHIHNCLKILEAFMTGNADSSLTSEMRLKQEKMLPLVTRLFHSLIVRSRTESPPIIAETMEALFRYLIATAHDDQAFCHSLVDQPSFLYNLLRLFVFSYEENFGVQARDAAAEDDGEENGPALLDRVSLSLGLITELVKQTDKGKDAIISTKFNTSCPLGKECEQECHCKNRVTVVQIFQGILNQPDGGHNPAMDAQAHFIRGAISILLGILCIHDEPMRTTVLSQIRAHGISRKESLQKLLDTIQEFVGLLSTVLARASREGQLASSSPPSPISPLSPSLRQSVNASGSSNFLSSPIKRAGKGQLDDGLHLAQAVLEGLKPLVQ